MKLIFLDIDGVLNYGGCKSRSPSGCLGIDDSKLALLKLIVDKTNARIVLTSTWKTEWELDTESQTRDGKYLEDRLSSVGLHIIAKTEDKDWSKRGQGILDFLYDFPYSVESFVILDDESFDFEFVGIGDKHVKTCFWEEGLLIEHVERAIGILNGC